MKKLTKISIEELKQEMPVMSENQQREIVGGGYVYDNMGTYLGTDKFDTENVYVMDVSSYNACRRYNFYEEQQGSGDILGMNIMSWGAQKLSDTDTSTQINVVSQIANNYFGQNYEFNISSGAWSAINTGSGIVITIPEGDQSLNKQSGIIGSIDKAIREAYGR